MTVDECLEAYENLAGRVFGYLRIIHMRSDFIRVILIYWVSIGKHFPPKGTLTRTRCSIDSMYRVAKDAPDAHCHRLLKWDFTMDGNMESNYSSYLPVFWEHL